MKTQNSQELLAKISTLQEEISQLKKRKKYGLVWENKPEEFEEKTKNTFPALKEKGGKFEDVISNASEECNVLIEGDNYHTLQILSYTHRDKIDIIYIDPPYNTGAKSWKYNNSYVDKDDQFRHSKWISMMYRRLKVARDVLSDDGSLICAIDDNEHATLGLMLHELFPSHYITCITIIHNPGGIQGNNFSYTNEYAYFVFPSNGTRVSSVKRDDVPPTPLRDWGGEESKREAARNCFYPIYVDSKGLITGFGDVMDDNFHPKSSVITKKDGSFEIYPIDSDGVERKWRFARNTVISIQDELKCEKINGVMTVRRYKQKYRWKTVWTDKKYNANVFGTQLLAQILDTKFPYPKSLYTVKDCLKAIIHNKDNATILDFFAGSGTTGQAVLELNKEDGGNRKFILCTNNENGICEEVTYERMRRVMQGYKDSKGKKIKGLGGNMKYLKADYVPKDIEGMVTDEDRLRLTYEAGLLLALKENAFYEIKKTKMYQVFSSVKKIVGVYFSENKKDIQEFLDEIDDNEKIVKAYIFSWEKGSYKNAFPQYGHISFEDIPEPILEVYKQLV